MRVMVNGLPGKMATEVAKHVIDSDDFDIVYHSLTGPEISDETVTIKGSKINLLKPERKNSIDGVIGNNRPFISVDATQPGAVNPNADFYCRNNLPFVMLTTGGDRKELEQRVRNSDIVAVIHTNMATQIVAYQALMKDFSNNHEGEWVQDKKSGLYIRESHQGVDIPNDFNGKEDTSGTAKDLVKSFNKIGVDFDEKDIAKIRDIEDQRILGVPEWALKGHGWHRYKLYSAEENKEIVIELFGAVFSFLQSNPVFEGYKPLISKLSGEQGTGIAMVSPDDNVLFRVEYRKGEVKIDHNVNGRGIYALGTLDALRFIKPKIATGEKGKVYSMINVSETA